MGRRREGASVNPEKLRTSMVRLEGFEPPTLGSLGTFPEHQLEHFVEDISRFNE
jgi:hypothetical protein